MGINKIKYDINTSQLVTIDIPERLVQGQDEKVSLWLDFGGFSYQWSVTVIFKRSDGAVSNEILATLTDGLYKVTLGSWFTDIEGSLTLTTRIQRPNVPSQAFGVATVPVDAGLSPSVDTITDAQYQALLLALNGLDIKTEEHIQKRDNPHLVTADQLGVYTKGEVDNIVGIDSGLISGLETKITNLENDKLDKTQHMIDLATKVDKTTKIMGIDLSNDISVAQIKTAIGLSSPVVDGLMSKEDKTHLNTLVAMLTDGNTNVVDTLQEILDIFQNYPEGVDLVNALSLKLDKSVYDANKLIVDSELLRLDNDKVDKTTTVIGIDLQDDITLVEFKTALGNATQALAGLMSAADKQHLDTLVGLLENDDSNIVDTIHEILEVFENYPQGADLAQLLAGKVDKVSGKGLSTNDFTDEYKNKVDNVVDDVSQLQTEKQDKLVAGANITIDENNVISTSGGKEFHRVRIFNNEDELLFTQMLYDGENVSKIITDKYLFEYGTENTFKYSTKIYEDVDLVLGDIPSRYVQTTVEDFNEWGDYTGTEEYIILPKDKSDGYNIRNVKGVATNGDYLTSTKDMFNGSPILYLELDYLNTSNVTNMFGMFASSQVTSLDLSNFDTSSVTNMLNMFSGTQVTELNLSNFDTSNVTNMGGMFSESQATTLDLSSFDTSNVTNMSYMFAVSQTTTLDLSSFDTSNVTNMTQMFGYSQATTGYARTQTDADKFNSTSRKPQGLVFEVK